MARHPRRDPKLEALRESGTLNPGAARVTDEAFRAGDFFDARDLVQVKYEMLRRVRVERTRVTARPLAFGVSRPTFYQAEAAFAQAGLAGLVPRKRGRRRAHKLTPDVMAYVQAAGEREPLDHGAGAADRGALRRHGPSAQPGAGAGAREKKRP